MFDATSKTNAAAFAAALSSELVASASALPSTRSDIPRTTKLSSAGGEYVYLREGYGVKGSA
jgi:hypothetical protein